MTNTCTVPIYVLLMLCKEITDGGMHPGLQSVEQGILSPNESVIKTTTKQNEGNDVTTNSNMDEEPCQKLNNHTANKIVRDSDPCQGYGDSSNITTSQVDTWSNRNTILPNKSTIHFRAMNVNNGLYVIQYSSLEFKIICMSLIVLGILGNLTTIIIILCRLEEGKPYYIAIVSLAVADFLSVTRIVLMRFLYDEILNFLTRLKMPQMGGVSRFAVEINSTLNIILISSIKHLLIVHPLWSKVKLTNKAVSLVSLLVFVISIASGVIIALFITSLRDKSHFYLYLVLFILPCFVITSQHLIKMREIRHSEAATGYKKKMNLVVSIILIIYIVSSFTRSVWAAVLLGSDEIKVDAFFRIVLLLTLVNYSSNPLLYFAFTPYFQKPLRLCLTRIAAKCSQPDDVANANTG